MSSIETRMSVLQLRVKEAEDTVKKRKRSVFRAERNLENAKNDLYAIRNEYDRALITSWDKPDWGFIFDYDDTETDVMSEYKRTWIQQAGLRSGGYNPETGQRMFCITFSSNSELELSMKIKMVEFILEYLKSDGKGEKYLYVGNIRSDEDCAWGFVSNQEKGEYEFIKMKCSSRSSIAVFASLCECLSFIQNASDTDTTPEHTFLNDTDKLNNL